MVTVKELLALPVLRRLKIVAGYRGLNKRVSSLTVMEVPDITKWLKGNDFIITSFYAVKDDVQKQIKLIDKLADLNCSCLAIKLGEFIEELDELIIEKANEKGLVLTVIPQDITYIELIVNGMEKILHNRDIEFMIEKYMKDIIFDNYEAYEFIIERGELLGFKIRESYSLAITLTHDDEDTDRYNEELRNLAKKVSKRSDRLLNFNHNPVVTIEGKSSVLFFADDKSDLKNNLKQILNLIKRYINDRELQRTKIGVGSIGKGLEGIKETYYNSIEVLKLIEILDNNDSIFYYDKLKIYLFMEKVLRMEDYKIFDDICGELSDDLLLTLKTFYQCNMDIINTSEKLYVHQNTVRYRLKKVKEITGFDTRIFEDNFKLKLFLMCNKIKKLL
ncbi:MAG TPA: PucR family transcriptional regulator ligand-binding domain-containing protein [Tissierellaceae bacterium]|nr:PucR family transcriptional regulator ligand-binding domain-containing protein [Tissierellaceae bacterium]